MNHCMMLFSLYEIRNSLLSMTVLKMPGNYAKILLQETKRVCVCVCLQSQVMYERLLQGFMSLNKDSCIE